MRRYPARSHPRSGARRWRLWPLPPAFLAVRSVAARLRRSRLHGWSSPAPRDQVVKVVRTDLSHPSMSQVLQGLWQERIVERILVPQPSHDGDQQRTVVFVTPELVEGVLRKSQRVVGDPGRLTPGIAWRTPAATQERTVGTERPRTLAASDTLAPSPRAARRSRSLRRRRRRSSSSSAAARRSSSTRSDTRSMAATSNMVPRSLSRIARNLKAGVCWCPPVSAGIRASVRVIRDQSVTRTRRRSKSAGQP